MERIDCVADPIALLWGLVLAHVAGASRVLAIVGALLAFGARLPAAAEFTISAQPMRARWKVFSAPREVAAAA